MSGSIKRYIEQYNGSHFVFGKSSDTLVVFCHGFTGKNPSTYWGKLEYLFKYETVLNNFDFLFFGYESSAQLYPNIFSHFGFARKMAEFDETAHNLAGSIKHYFSKNSYKYLHLVGHSLGSHLVLRAAVHANQVGLFHTNGICLIAAPNFPSRLAKIHNFVSWGRNPQVQFLSSDKDLTDSLINLTTSLRTPLDNSKIVTKIVHIHSVHDNFVRHDPNLIYDDTRTIQAPHTWFRDINNIADPHYQLLVSWISSGAF